jgi:hypothetical protein
VVLLQLLDTWRAEVTPGTDEVGKHFQGDRGHEAGMIAAPVIPRGEVFRLKQHGIR